MDIVAYLRPKFVLMENVVDIVKFAGGFLGRYALARLVAMDYQARMGLMSAGAYGLPQYRMRMFMWGALQSEVMLFFFFCFALLTCQHLSRIKFYNLLLTFPVFLNSICPLSSPLQRLPQYPLPTHNVVVRGVTPTEFDVRLADFLMIFFFGVYFL